MSGRKVMFGGFFVLVSLLVATPALAASKDAAAQSFEEGNALLAKADFEGAKKAFASAARADSQNQAYRQQYAVVRRVMKMRKAIEKESNAEKWEAIARALHTFYHQHKVFGESLILDRALHEKLGTAESAVMLADSQLALDMNADAAETLSKLESGKVSEEAKALKGVALAREKKVEEAKAIAADCKTGENPSSKLLLDLARLNCLIGAKDKAVGFLTKSFERTPPSMLDGFKANAKECADFAGIASSAEFGKALATASKVQESGCSGGTSCGSCPSRGNCGSSSSTTSKH